MYYAVYVTTVHKKQHCPLWKTKETKYTHRKSACELKQTVAAEFLASTKPSNETCQKLDSKILQRKLKQITNETERRTHKYII